MGPVSSQKSLNIEEGRIIGHRYEVWHQQQFPAVSEGENEVREPEPMFE